MRCFLGCFSASKHKKRMYLVNAAPSKDELRDGNGVNEALQLDVTTEHQLVEEPIKLTTESKEKKLEEQLSCNKKREVTFDLNAKGSGTNNVVGENQEKESEKQESSDEIKSNSNLISSNEASNPSNNRCQNYSKEEFEDLDSHDGDLDDNNDSKILVEEESSESLFSLSIDSRKQAYGGEVGEKEVSSPIPKCASSHEQLKVEETNPSSRDRSQNVDSVLNPVENLTQWQPVKARATLSMRHQDKENINIQQNIGKKEPCFELLSKKEKGNLDQKKLLDQDVAIDTSLSSWLVESEATPLSEGSANSVGNSASGKGSSPRSIEGEHILRALTKNESTTARRRSLSSDDTPIFGTVGSYWRHTGRIVDSDSSCSSKGIPKAIRKYAEDEKANCNPSAFEARLGRDLDKVLA